MISVLKYNKDCTDNTNCSTGNCGITNKCECATGQTYNSKVEGCLEGSLIGESCTHADNCTYASMFFF